MLCRTANDLYWTARHIERAENMARLIDVAQRIRSCLPCRNRTENRKPASRITTHRRAPRYAHGGARSMPLGSFPRTPGGTAPSCPRRCCTTCVWTLRIHRPSTRACARRASRRARNVAPSPWRCTKTSIPRGSTSENSAASSSRAMACRASSNGSAHVRRHSAVLPHGRHDGARRGLPVHAPYRRRVHGTRRTICIRMLDIKCSEPLTFRRPAIRARRSGTTSGVRCSTPCRHSRPTGACIARQSRRSASPN